jgi:hypothetical protein
MWRLLIKGTWKLKVKKVEYPRVVIRGRLRGTRLWILGCGKREGYRIERPGRFVGARGEGLMLGIAVGG